MNHPTIKYKTKSFRTCNRNFVSIIAITLCLVFFSSCCKTVTMLGGILGKDNQNINKIKDNIRAYEIWTCPDQPVTIGWYVSSDVKNATIDNGVGAVKIPYGFTTVYPKSDITYTLTATGGDCTQTSTVFIKIIKPGTTGSINLPLNKMQRITTSYWETFLDPQFYDPNIIVTSISIDHDDFGGTPKGWNLRKQDVNGSPHQFLPIQSISSAPTGFPMQLAGKHNIIPFDPNTPDWTTAPQILTETLTLDCKK